MKLGYARYCMDCEEVFNLNDAHKGVCPMCGSPSIFNLYNVLNRRGNRSYLDILIEERRKKNGQVQHQNQPSAG